MVDVELTEVPSEIVAMVRRVVPMDGLPSFFGEAFEMVAAAVPEAGGVISGPPFGWYHGMPTETVDVAAGFPVSGDVHVPDGGVVVAERPGGRALVAIHVGSYDGLAQAWGDILRKAEQESLTLCPGFWEDYLSDPTGDPSTWRTRLVALLA